MTALRRLGYLALALGFLQIVFGAVVRITGSGMGCGDYWPNCAGGWLPSLARPALVIEIFHRFGALLVSLSVVALAVVAGSKRREPGVGGRGGVLRAATLAVLLIGVAIVLGAAAVKLALNPAVVVIHKALAITLLATLASVVIRAGGLGARWVGPGAISPRTFRGARAAAALAFAVVVLGALTANVPGANVACRGFPLCGSAPAPGGAAYVQLTHRILAYLLFLHLLGVAVGTTRRREAPPARRLAWASFGVVLLQLIVAAALVELALPAVLRSLHQALGIVVWLVTFTFAALGRRAAATTTTVVGGGGGGPGAPPTVDDEGRAARPRHQTRAAGIAATPAALAAGVRGVVA